MESITERIDGVTAIPAAYRASVLPAPRSVKVELSPRCNWRCSFCALRTRESQPSADMEWELFARVAGEMREAGVEELGLFYLGESFMNPELLVRAVKYAKRHLEFPYVFLTSNASLASPVVVERVMAAGLDSLKWSVNAADEVQFARMMGVKKRLFGQALGHIRAAFEVRERGAYATRLYASSIRYDGEQLARMERLLDESVRPFVDEHYWLPLYGQMVSVPFREAAAQGMAPNAGNQGRLGALRDPLPCWSLFTEGHVRADGSLSACCFDSDGRFQMGDLKTQGFMEAWNSAAFQKLRAAHLEKDVSGTICEGCIAYA